ncbi:MAG: SCO6880 family protein, partial [Acidimicrobiia bacterium]
DQLLTWGEAGPVGAEETWAEYRHDSGYSRTYGWHEAPRQQVTANVLCALLQPARWPTRVTLFYRPLSAAHAARELEGEVNAATIRAMIRAKQGRDESARDVADRERARQAAHEEAIGAGVVRTSLVVTVTVTDPGDLPQACADIEARAQQSKIRLRPLYGAQGAGFAATLPAGVHPAHVRARARR